MAAIAPSSVEAATFLTDLRNSGSTLGVLVVGESGSGKSTLIDNLQLEANENYGVVTVYKASEAQTAQVAWENIKNGKHDKWVVIFCIPLTENRMRADIIDSFKKYHDLGINWTKTVFALTFADAMPIPRSVKQNPNYSPARFFNQRTQEWEENIRKVFHKQICGSKIASAKMFPATGYNAERLPNGNEWFDSAWSEIIDAASRDPTFSSKSTPPSKVRVRANITLFVIASVVFGFFVGGGVGAGIGWPEGDVIGVSLSIPFGAGLGVVVGMLTGFCAALYCRKCASCWHG